MSDYARDDPTGPASVGGTGTVGDVGSDSAADDTDRIDPDADAHTDPATERSEQ